jgi:hypothetical protein
MMDVQYKAVYKERIPFEDTKRIDIRSLMRSGCLDAGIRGSLSWLVGGESQGTIAFKCHDGALMLGYRYKGMDGGWVAVKQSVSVVAMDDANVWQQRFLCPGCEARVNVLVGYGKHFLCRHCYRMPHGSMQGKAISYDADHAAKDVKTVSDLVAEADAVPVKRVDSLFDEYCELVIAIAETDTQHLAS